MTTRHRLTIRTLDRDPRIHVLADAVDHLGIELQGAIDVADVVFVEGRLDADDLARLHDVLVDPLLQHGSWELPTTHGIEITLLPGVTDTAADAVLHAARVLGLDVTSAAMGRRVEFDDRVSTEVADDIVRRLVANPVIERWSPGTIEPPMVDPTVAASVVDVIAIRGLDDDGLAKLNEDRALYLDIEELRAIRDQYERLGRDITDVEIEVLAQTWSEHCSHKTFRASIEIDQGGPNERTVEPLLAQLRRCTEDLDAPFVRSAFVGNAGVIEFAEGTTIALKAETHNHPSAVEPFGGANTGVGGVIRDVLGIAHRPIAVTDVLCFGPADLPLDDLPAGALHPRRIRDGVIDGVADYGNKIGLPTVAGAILYDPAYTTNPLVFAGCIGSAPTRPLHTGPAPGDRVVVLGGSTGRDGIRGATFSSATMDATTGEVAGASVQIGDPVVEKLLIDALVGAEDLYSAITDCGAGGLSSAVGEMAEGIGADVELELVPRKYPGLQAWEVWLSEAQERMVIAVPPVHLDALRQRCDRVGVAVADIGVFTGDGRLIVRDAGHVVADIDTGFLHDGRPQRRMTATLPTPDRTAVTGRTVDDPAATLARPAGPSEHRLQGHHDPPLRPRDPRSDGGATVVRRPRRRARRWRRARRAGLDEWAGGRDRREPLVRPPRPRGDGRRRRRRGHPQRGRRRRRPHQSGAARQLLLGRSATTVDPRRTGGSRRGLLQRRRGASVRRSSPARTPSTTSTSVRTASATPCHRRW